MKLILAGGAAIAIAAAATLGTYVSQKRAAAGARDLPAIALPAGPVSILLIGDSRIARWPKRQLPPGCAVIGFGGATARNIGAVAGRYFSAARPDTVVIQAGYNDAVAAALHSPAGAEAILRRAGDAVAGMAAGATGAGAKRTIVLTVAPPMKPDLIWRAIYGWRVERHVAALNRRIARLPGVEIVDAAALFRDGRGGIDPRFAADASHFSEPGYRVLAAAVFPRHHRAAPSCAGRPGG